MAIVGGLLGGVAVISLVAVVLVVGPWLLFWSIATLTGFTIELTFKTWLAAFVLLALVRGGGGSSS